MNLVLRRETFTDKSTIGSLYIDGVFECYTLEDTCRQPKSLGAAFEVAYSKVKGKTAIPTGTYIILLDRSPKFGRILPHLLEVPGFTRILIHSGNTPEDTEGCILVGKTKDTNWVGQSRNAFEDLFTKLDEAYTLPQMIQITVT